MKKKIVVLMLSAAMTMSMMTGCGNTAKDDSASTTTETTQDAEATEEAEPTEEVLSDSFSCFPPFRSFVSFIITYFSPL